MMRTVAYIVRAFEPEPNIERKKKSKQLTDLDNSAHT